MIKEGLSGQKETQKECLYRPREGESTRGVVVSLTFLEAAIGFGDWGQVKCEKKHIGRSL